MPGTLTNIVREPSVRLASPECGETTTVWWMQSCRLRLEASGVTVIRRYIMRDDSQRGILRSRQNWRCYCRPRCCEHRAANYNNPGAYILVIPRANFGVLALTSAEMRRHSGSEAVFYSSCWTKYCCRLVSCRVDVTIACQAIEDLRDFNRWSPDLGRPLIIIRALCGRSGAHSNCVCGQTWLHFSTGMKSINSWTTVAVLT